MKKIIWTAHIENAPAAVRYCKKCGQKTEFMSSGMFRVNAQQKSLDVWLIYKCAACNTTWNMTVLTRINPNTISNKILQRFHENAPKLALQYASDIALIKRNGAELGKTEVKLLGEAVDFAEPTCLHIVSAQHFDVKVSSLLRQKWDLSRSEFDSLCKSGRIICTSGHDLKKCKLGGEIIVEIQ